MATVAHERQLAQRIEGYIGYLEREWSGIPELAAAWDGWDEDSKLSFVLDWPIREDRLWQLDGWADQGLLTDEQQLRFDSLLEVIACYRPTLEKLLAD
jgi:hypothetical protein